ncbi:hypothetical protein [Haloarcula sp. 1CSR25-25]|uniref:hypothetical protein n=1 Tax=Haloarcula sp. 1CSR25-25 TaxID=2862545 RepID=UPI002894CC20|nr:hypothetical protein [Haloarcula sp. 1CSR25-25]MDT3434681.1 hypothetical protein [Haloarcula sp. 1CSR25-25]
MTSYTIDDGDGGTALDENQQHYRGDGIGVVDPAGGDLAVSVNTGALGSTDTLSVAAGDAYIQGTTHTLGSQSIGLDGANGTDPRRDVVYVDTTGSLQVENGTPEATAPDDSNLYRFEYFRPAPADLSETVACVLAEVWVPAGATSVTSSDIRDRRIRALQADSLTQDIATQTELDTHASDPDNHHKRPSAGDGLVDASGTFDIEPADFAGAGVADDGSDDLVIQERIHYEPGHTEIPDGQDDVEYHRIVPPSDGTVTITAMQFRQQGGGSSSNCTLDVYDAGVATVVTQITLGSADRATYTAEQGNTVLVRMSNATGGPIDAAPTIDGYIDT